MAAVDPARMPYVQLRNAPASAPEQLVVEAFDGRLTLGAGALPVSELVDVLPSHTALSFEIRSGPPRSHRPGP